MKLFEGLCRVFFAVSLVVAAIIFFPFVLLTAGRRG